MFANLKTILISGGIIAVMSGIIWFNIKTINDLKSENGRLADNIENINFEVRTSKSLNDELIFSVKNLTVKGDELQSINSKLYADITNMNLKLKNLQSVVNIGYEISDKIDKIESERVPSVDGEGLPQTTIVDKSGTYKFDRKDNNTTFTGNIVVPNDAKTNPYLSDVKYTMKDSLLIANEFKYKRSWIFWKKVVGVETHVKSSNPNFKIDQMQSFQVTK